MYYTVFIQEDDLFYSFYSGRSAQTALCNWPIEQEKATLEDLFIGRIRDIDVQSQLIKAKVNLEDTLQVALESEKGRKLRNNFKNCSRTTNRQHPILTPYGSSKNLHPRYNSSVTHQRLAEGEVIIGLTNAQVSQNLVTSVCGNPFTLEHCRSCPAREATCNACKKKGHFAKMCKTTKRRVNMIQQEQLQLAQECDFIDVGEDSEPDYRVMAIDVVQINSVELLRADGGKP